MLVAAFFGDRATSVLRDRESDAHISVAVVLGGRKESTVDSLGSPLAARGAGVSTW